MLIMIVYLYVAVSWMWSEAEAYCQNTVHVQNMSSCIHYYNAQVCLSVNVSRGGLTFRETTEISKTLTQHWSNVGSASGLQTGDIGSGAYYRWRFNHIRRGQAMEALLG